MQDSVVEATEKWQRRNNFKILFFQLMEDGRIGLSFPLALLSVEEESRREAELARSLHQTMEEPIVLAMAKSKRTVILMLVQVRISTLNFWILFLFYKLRIWSVI